MARFARRQLGLLALGQGRASSDDAPRIQQGLPVVSLRHSPWAGAVRRRVTLLALGWGCASPTYAARVGLALLVVSLGCSRAPGDGQQSSTKGQADAVTSRQSSRHAEAERSHAELRSAEQPRRIDPKTHQLPRYTVSALGPGETIVIDGVLNEPAWTSAVRTRDFVNPGTGEPVAADAALRGNVRLRYDQEALYFGFEALDHDVRGEFDPRLVDPQLWTRDTVEIMLDPDGDGDNRDYYELQINPQGLVFDSLFDAYNSPRVLPDGPFGHQEFDAQLRRAITIQGTLNDSTDRDTGYVVEAALPWKRLTRAQHAPPRARDEWRANFYVMQNNGGVSWSPILGQGNFHKASQFGRLVFGD